MPLIETLTLRPLHEDDCRLLWEWANDPEMRVASFSSAPIPWEDHRQWFAQQLRQSQLLWIGIDNRGNPIGQVRFDMMNNEENASISISIGKGYRGKGWSSKLITMAVENLFQRTRVEKIHAFIKSDNLASIRAFEKAQFESQGIQQVKGQQAVHYLRVKVARFLLNKRVLFFGNN